MPASRSCGVSILNSWRGPQEPRDRLVSAFHSSSCASVNIVLFCFSSSTSCTYNHLPEILWNSLLLKSCLSKCSLLPSSSPLRLLSLLRPAAPLACQQLMNPTLPPRLAWQPNSPPWRPPSLPLVLTGTPSTHPSSPLQPLRRPRLTPSTARS